MPSAPIVTYSTGCSREVTHLGTNPARRCLTSVISREPVCHPLEKEQLRRPSERASGGLAKLLAPRKIHVFAGRAVKRERRKGSSRRQQPAYGAAVNEVARELLRSARSPKRENGGRRYIKHDGMIVSPVGSCLCC